jgi:hypothetical protein
VTEDEKGQRFQQAVAKLDPEQQEHFKTVVLAMLDCYTNDKMHGMLIVRSEDEALTSIFAINSNEMDAAQLLASAQTHVDSVVMADAPPREMFN